MRDAENRATNRAAIEAELGSLGDELRWRQYPGGDVLVIGPGDSPTYRVAFAECMLELEVAHALRGSRLRDYVAPSLDMVVLVTPTPGNDRLILERVPGLPEWAR